MTDAPPPLGVNSNSHPTAEVSVLIVSDDVMFLDSLSQTLNIRLPTLSRSQRINSTL
ncbi:MAG: hypothetical protein N4J56_007069 [Chroococcidiopsis sp. SAG 2025]|uniref:hypothetical protein n=1 Tax=Chroococcidiopsis sp. SAG 2025 TaxID=171389 RepID=UPI002936F7B2|nr:hypothetical protein [Chroococcidiopsis sp. SAG 2025]MDV2997364.1 hypothetical protein [Chroococcidiopsis sp. SAG 2025]